jgi:hypothetical protein
MDDSVSQQSFKRQTFIEVGENMHLFTKSKSFQLNAKQNTLFIILVTCTIIVLSSCNKDIAGPPDPPQRLVINRILFISNRANPRSSQIYSMNPDGSGIRRITHPTDSISFLFAVWSPDLQKIAVVWNYYDIQRREFPMLSVIDTLGNILYHLSSRCYTAPPVWSPDGNEVAFAISKSYFAVVPQIFIATIGGEFRQITNYGLSAVPTVDTSSMPMHWTNHCLFAIMHFDSVYYDSQNRWSSVRWGALAEIDLSGKLIKIIFEDRIKDPCSADISIDSEIILNYWRYGSITGLFTLAQDGKPLRQLGKELFFQVDSRAYGLGSEWSPDASRIAFSIVQAKYPGSEWIYTIDRLGNTMQQITSDSASVNFVADWR